MKLFKKLVGILLTAGMASSILFLLNAAAWYAIVPLLKQEVRTIGDLVGAGFLGTVAALADIFTVIGFIAICLPEEKEAETPR